jgi:hypothetical protein
MLVSGGGGLNRALRTGVTMLRKTQRAGVSRHIGTQVALSTTVLFPADGPAAAAASE